MNRVRLLRQTHARGTQGDDMGTSHTYSEENQQQHRQRQSGQTQGQPNNKNKKRQCLYLYFLLISGRTCTCKKYLFSRTSSLVFLPQAPRCPVPARRGARPLGCGFETPEPSASSCCSPRATRLQRTGSVAIVACTREVSTQHARRAHPQHPRTHKVRQNGGNPGKPSAFAFVFCLYFSLIFLT
jgi:hypothetical protein